MWEEKIRGNTRMRRSGVSRVTSDRIAGGRGSDRIVGGRGRDRIAAGKGADRVDARGGGRDRVSCGGGRDRVRADRRDRIAGDCERVLVGA